MNPKTNNCNKNMLIPYQQDRMELYEKDLSLVASLSRLYSENEKPFIHYRATESIYCNSFGAKNVSRNDTTADVILGNVGIGIKTFLESDSYQKITEFDKESDLFFGKSPKAVVKTVAEHRNERILLTKKRYGIERLIYHYTVRDKGAITIYEENMNPINIKGIKNIKTYKNTIKFSDGVEDYSFSKAKNTLMKKFKKTNPIVSFKVDVLEDPMEYLRKISSELRKREATHVVDKEFIVLPLYSTDKNDNRFVAPRSGLNQWNAKGRLRDPNEIYIPFPASIRKLHMGFFPPKDQKWNMHLPDGKVISMKVCQADGKALMSDPNKDLGKWMLRQVLGLDERELLTYEKLCMIGVDSIIISKDGDLNYSIDLFKDEDLVD